MSGRGRDARAARGSRAHAPRPADPDRLPNLPNLPNLDVHDGRARVAAPAKASGGLMAPASMVDMRVVELGSDPLTNMPILVLHAVGGNERLAIAVGATEAASIACRIEGIELRRPTAHDLLRAVLVECGARVDRVELRDLRGDTFFAVVVIERGGGESELDARPSDAIAVALGAGAPIRVARRVIERARRSGVLGGDGEEPMPGPGGSTGSVACGGAPDLHAMRARPDLLALLSDEDFGKWKM